MDDSATQADAACDQEAQRERVLAACPVVGIGSSTGALDALRRLLAAVPPASGLAFVVVQHLDPAEPADLAAQLAGSTDMAVRTAEHGAAVEPDHVYVIPPAMLLRISEARLTLGRPDQRYAHRNAIDEFFLALAEDQGSNAACVILSGTGSDGTIGLRAAKEQGGLTLAQSDVPYDGIMRSVVGSIVDFLLPAEAIPAKLSDFFRQASKPAEGAGEAADHLKQVIALLRAQTGHDFSDYKDKTIIRRVQRRMQVLQLHGADDFIERLRKDPQEVGLLFRDLLIGVTSFFRDPGSFKALEREVIPLLFHGRGPNDSIRIWVPGCSTGEEAYSIAMLLRERAPRSKGLPKLQIFASDIDDQAIDTARNGRYPASVTKDIPPHYLDRYFTREDGTYRIAADLREICLFSVHNLLRDPPFSKLDLISCRNLLIYFGSELQNRVIPLFHYSLNPKGFLFLGTSENVTRHPRMFIPLDKKHRIFQRSPQADGKPLLFPLAAPSQAHHRDPAAAVRVPGRDASLKGMAERLLLDRFSPAYVVINSDGDVLLASGRTGTFLELPSGAPDNNIYSMARPGLGIDLRVAMHKAVSTGRPVVQRRVIVGLDGAQQEIDLHVQPLRVTAAFETTFYMLVFQELGPVEGAKEGEDSAATEDVPGITVRQLEAELRAARERLQSTTEELESSNEELKSSNEELSSMNEELQSTNEELETSKEELQSINEELQTVNAELHGRVEELGRTHNDMLNLLENTQIATVFLDRELRVKSFTPAAKELFRLVESDTGRPISHIRPLFELRTLQEDAERVLRSLATIEHPIRSTENNGRYTLRLLPYRTADNVISGVVLTFTDMTRDFEAEARIDELSGKLGARIKELETLLDLVPVGVMIAEGSDRPAVRINPYGARLLGTGVDGTSIGPLPAPFRLFDASGREILRDEQPLERAARTGEAVPVFEGRLRGVDGDMTDVMLTAAPLLDDAGAPRGAIAAIVDISGHKKLEARQRVLLNELQHRVKNTLATVSGLAVRMGKSRPSAEEFKEGFLSRLLAMGSMHDLLARGSWEGTTLRTLLGAALDFYANVDRSNILLTGEDVVLSANDGTALGMILHELATNAAKYGALSAVGGQVEVAWQAAAAGETGGGAAGGRRLRIDWTERGGPAPSQAPSDGFGTGFIRRSVEYDLNGTVELAFTAEGLRCTFEFGLADTEGARPLPS